MASLEREETVGTTTTATTTARTGEKGVGEGRVENVEGQEREVPRLSSGMKVKRHFRKWWWAHLILFLGGTLLITLLLCYVAFPRIAQDGVNKSTLEVQSLSLTNPTATSFHLNQVAVIRNDNAYHPQLDAFNASLSLAGSGPYAYITLPAVIAGEVATTTVDQDVQITDPQAFADYNVAVLTKESVDVAIDGATGLHEMAFPATTVNYNKVATLKGLNNLAGFNVTEFKILLLPDKTDGANMLGTVYISNPSVMTIEMGNVSFLNYLPTNPPTLIGNTTLTDLILKPGNNTIPMRSTVNQTLILTALTSTYKDGIVPIDVVGDTAVYNGVHLTWLEKALKVNKQSITLNVGAALAALGVHV